METNVIDSQNKIISELKRMLSRLESLSASSAGGATEDNQDIQITLEQYEAWEFIPGNSKVITYYTGVEPGNPSGSIRNIKTIELKTGAATVILQALTYNGNNQVLTITAS